MGRGDLEKQYGFQAVNQSTYDKEGDEDPAKQEQYGLRKRNIGGAATEEEDEIKPELNSGGSD